VSAVKLFRDWTGVGLMEAPMMHRHGWTGPREFGDRIRLVRI
jgi:hypothetical protein